MNKGLKAILIIILLILLSIFLPIIAIYYFVASKSLDLTSLQRLVLTNEYIQSYLFWAAVVLAILTVVIMLIILLYPKRVSTFILKEQRGALALDKRAIEGYVRTSLKQENFMDTPKVNVIATKNKLKVNVRGQLKKTSALIDRTDDWAKGMEKQIHQLLGSKEKFSINLKFYSFDSDSSKTGVVESRVG